MRKLALFALLCLTAACDRPVTSPAAAPAATGRSLAEVLRSTPRAAGVDLTRAGLEAQAASATRGYRDERRAFPLTLDDLTSFSLRVEAGRCYRAVVRLDGDATFSDLAER